ncbi:hypothetical protein GP486_002592 [Trichoglossum hirsutum]|uniref:Uncharacterized protein n=1 Tax=Trichoglossum hirsutum TaxID=265104 RepID=A0A9P8LEN2_9PEZI|nr:hypothetical protein GP486_002592 [Trichoglossum hirsutum]
MTRRHSARTVDHHHGEGVARGAENTASYARARDHIEGFKRDYYYRDDNSDNDVASAAVAVSSEAFRKDFLVDMSREEWVRLCGDLHLDEGHEEEGEARFKHPKCSYDASSSTLVVHAIPSPVHESIIKIFEAGFIRARSNLQVSDASRTVRTITDERHSDFRGRHQGSTKFPDLGVIFKRSDGRLQLKLVVEVGFPEKYDSLVRDARLWLEGSRTVPTVILVQVEESPSYSSPLSNLEDEEIERLGLSRQPEYDFSAGGDFGPVVFKGLVWVGRITRVFMEVWRWDPLSGLATRDGDRMDFLPPVSLPQLEFKLGDFITSPPEDVPIRFAWDVIREELKKSIVALAAERYGDAIRKLECRAGGRDSRDNGGTAQSASSGQFQRGSANIQFVSGGLFQQESDNTQSAPGGQFQQRSRNTRSGETAQSLSGRQFQQGANITQFGNIGSLGGDILFTGGLFQQGGNNFLTGNIRNIRGDLNIRPVSAGQFRRGDSSVQVGSFGTIGTIGGDVNIGNIRLSGGFFQMGNNNVQSGNIINIGDISNIGGNIDLRTVQSVSGRRSPRESTNTRSEDVEGDLNLS